MRTALKVSVLLNLVLIAGLFFIWRLPSRENVAIRPPMVTNEMLTARLVVAAPPMTGRQTQPSPFRWTQLESQDYRTYVRNLRAFGCPEATLRAIVVADVDRRYNRKFDELERQISDLGTNSLPEQLATLNLQESLRRKLQTLPAEEADEINDMLSYNPAPATTVAATPPPARQAQRSPRATPLAMPLIFQQVDTATVNLNPAELQGIADLRQRFWNEIGGPNQDPADPAYHQRWQQAQPEIDNMLRGMIGKAAFQQYQTAAARSEKAHNP